MGLAQKMGNYELVERIGQGRMGEVWRAFDLKLRVEVALKALRAGLATERSRRRFEEEAELLAQRAEREKLAFQHAEATAMAAFWVAVVQMQIGTLKSLASFMSR